MEATPQSEPLPAWVDPFPEPRTMPGGWDLSGLLKTAHQSAAEEAGPSQRAGEKEAPEGGVE